MLTRVVLVVLGAILIAPAVTSVIRAQSADEPVERGALEQLRERIEKLEARVEQLEKQPRLRVTPQTPPYAPGQRRIPEDWQEREFNGLPFYIIPCEKATQGARQPGSR
jgi:hypothetical protein